MRSTKYKRAGLEMLIVVFLTGAIFLSVSAKDASAQMLSYAAKFVCGPKSNDLGAVKGMYSTGVNIHNPQMVTVKFQKKAVVAKAERSKRGPISLIKDEHLYSDEAMEVDCTDIQVLIPSGCNLRQAH